MDLKNKKRIMKDISSTLLLLTLLILFFICFRYYNRDYTSRLYVPTMIQKIDDTYFIVDCWNHRVLYNNSFDKDIKDWKTLTDESYVGGHTIASDGELYVLDNTDRNQVLCYKKTDDGTFKKVITIGNINTRPHFVVYDEINSYFYVIGSTTAMIYTFKNIDGILQLIRSDFLPELEGAYVRSITLIDNKLYTACGNSSICEYAILDDGFCLEKSYLVPDEMYGMNQLVKIQDYFYLTINTDKQGDITKTNIYRTKSLEDLATGNYESLYESMGFKEGQPYFITTFDNKFFVTQISAEWNNGVKSFDVIDNEIVNVKDEWLWKEVIECSKSRYNSKYSVETSGDKREVVDLFLFCGQSNMAGKGDAAFAPEVEYGYEFRAITDPAHLYRIYEPLGINENQTAGINDMWMNTNELRKQGGLISSFANTYYEETGVPIVAVSCSEGATIIEQWQPDSERYADLVNRCKLAKNYLNSSENYEVRYVYLVWCQGESDGDSGTSFEVYYDKLKRITDTLVEQEIVDKCMIIQTGNNADNVELYEPIQEAQARLCEDSANCILISELAKSFVENGKMKDNYHYTQEGYNLLGEDAGEKAAEYSNQNCK